MKKPVTRVRKTGRRYTDEQRAKVLAVLKANAGNVKKTAREVGVPPVTIRGWRDEPDQAAPAEVREKAARDLASEIDEIRWAYLERARQKGAINSTSGFYAVQAAQKLTEMHRLLQGESTENIATQVTYVEPGTLRRVALAVIEGGKAMAS